MVYCVIADGSRGVIVLVDPCLKGRLLDPLAVFQAFLWCNIVLYNSLLNEINKNSLLFDFNQCLKTNWNKSYLRWVPSFIRPDATVSKGLLTLFDKSALDFWNYKDFYESFANFSWWQRYGSTAYEILSGNKTPPDCEHPRDTSPIFFAQDPQNQLESIS